MTGSKRIVTHDERAAGRRVTRPRDVAPAMEEALGAYRLTVLDVVTDIAAECPWGARAPVRRPKREEMHA